MSEFNQLDLVVFHFSLLFYSLVFMDLAQGHRVTSYLSRMCHTCHSYGHEISDMAEIEICNTMFHVSVLMPSLTIFHQMFLSPLM